MKKIILMVFIAMIAINVKAQDSTRVENQTKSDSVLMGMNIIQFCKEFEIPSEYDKRYEAIISPLCDAGIAVRLFNKKNNIYGKNDCYDYAGNSIQNEILKRNILANRTLIKKGHLSVKDAKKWKIVK